MDDVTTKTNKTKEDKVNVEELVLENKQKPEIMDVSIFDETLNEIDKILNTLEQKSNIERNQLEKLNVLPKIKSAISKIHLAKNELIKEENNLIKKNNLIKRIENLEKKINNSNKTSSLFNELKDQTINETKEHKIDKNLLSIDRFHDFEENDEKKNKNTFGFYSYLILIIVIFFAFYGTLDISKDIIVLKFPITEPYIQYFFEIVEIIKVSILGVADFIKNKI
jgi:hypothetical protein